MKPMASNKLLVAFLALVTVGLGLQTYSLVRVHHELDALRASSAEVPIAEARAPEPLALQQQSPLAPRDPLTDFEAAEARMRGLFDTFYERFDQSFGDSYFDTPFALDGDSFLMDATGLIGPRIDLQDSGDHYEVIVDVPGAEEADVTVRTEDGTLIIEGSRATASETSEPGSYVRRERQFGRFERRLPLPQDADSTTQETTFENGVLKVTFQKSA
jgi:HSP20 family protein